MRRPGPTREILDVPNGSGTIPWFQFDIEHLVEIAVVELTVITNADQRAAHQAVDCARIEIPFQEIHIDAVLALAPQLFFEPVNGHVGDGQQVMELNSEALAKMLLVVGFELCLGRR